MFEFCMKIVPIIEVAFFPIIFAVIYSFTGENNFIEIAVNIAEGMLLFTIWLWAVAFLFDFFKEWRKKREKWQRAQRELENWRQWNEK